MSSSNGFTEEEKKSPTSGWSLYFQAKALRYLASLAFNIQYYTSSSCISATKTEYIDSTFGCSLAKQSIKLDIYEPPQINDKSKPCLIVFHGGGFVIGNGTDDSIFAKAAIEKLDCIVIAVSYRLSPEYPFPIPLEDCISSILYISQNHNKYGIDRNDIMLSGFSAGGNLALASQHVLTSLKSPSNQWGYRLPPGMDKDEIPKIKGIILFYPLLNYSIPRQDKIKNLEKPEYALPTSLTRLFDLSYLPNIPKSSEERKDIRISPSLASDELLGKLPPLWITLCEYDMLRKEGLNFIEKLESLNKSVGWSEVKEEKHGWDKPPPMTQKESVKVEYGKALDAAKGWLE